jgi:hypothetical protein
MDRYSREKTQLKLWETDNTMAIPQPAHQVIKSYSSIYSAYFEQGYTITS